MVIVKCGYKWILYTKDQKRILGKFKTKKEALKREKQIIYFKNLKSEPFKYLNYKLIILKIKGVNESNGIWKRFWT